MGNVLSRSAWFAVIAGMATAQLTASASTATQSASASAHNTDRTSNATSQKKNSLQKNAALRKNATTAIERALRFLASKQADDGGWPGPTGHSDPAITALAAKTFIQHPTYGPNHRIVKQAIHRVLSFRQPDGGFYDPQFGYGNYSTSICLMTLAAMKKPETQEHIISAQRWLKNNQWAEGKCDNDGKPIDPTHSWYGGAGYGKHRRPDLSNTQMMLEALHQSGLPANDPAFQRALRFIQRSQMLEQTNDQPFARGENDGGFIYTPAQGGQSQAGEVTVDNQRRLRSYGSMTYAGFKSMIYANVDRNDLRIQRAWAWIRQNYTLDANPNMPGAQSQDGLYYYYHVFAKTLEAWGQPMIPDPQGNKHDWRSELCHQLIERQQPDGSWVNNAPRWQEDNPCLVTAYAVLSLQTALRRDPSPKIPGTERP